VIGVAFTNRSTTQKNVITICIEFDGAEDLFKCDGREDRAVALSVFLRFERVVNYAAKDRCWSHIVSCMLMS
jgi:hypothetical protein